MEGMKVGAASRWRDPLTLAAVALVLYAGLCKALLFRNLEYLHTDLLSFVEMSRSWYFWGSLLYDNAYGHQAAIHNFYLLLAFSPLTIPLGAYGLILGLVLLELAAVLRTAGAASLGLAGRLVVLQGLLGPIAFAVFDNPSFGFHPELCYPPLAVLLALELREGKPWRATLLAVLVVLVKEDGAVLCFSVLAAHFAGRLWATRHAPAEERLAVVRAAALSLLASAVAFVAGLALLWAVGRTLPGASLTAEARIVGSLRLLAHAIAGRGHLAERLLFGVLGYAVAAAATLLPLARRALHGLGMLLVSSPPLLVVLALSSAVYRFNFMLWPLRLSPFLALTLACLVLAAPARRTAPAGRALRSLAWTAALVAVSWGLQLGLLARTEGYSPLPRLRLLALMDGAGYRAATLDPDEVRFLRCLGGRLPPALAVMAPADVRPVFHRQAIVFDHLEAHAWEAPRLRIVPRSRLPAAPPAGWCRDAGVGRDAVDAQCDLMRVVESCRRSP
jgi:hypothetical protein